MRIRIIMYGQDDPKKCTAVQLERLGLARRTRKPHRNTILLDPYSQNILLPGDAGAASSITAVDCSWARADSTFGGFGGRPRSLPPLLAGNPVNYSKIGRLSTAEAICGALFILGCQSQARDILSRFSWGHTFYDLNECLLAEYAKASSASSIQGIIAEYGLDAQKH